MKSSELRIFNIVRMASMAGGIRIPTEIMIVGEVGLFHVQLYYMDDPIACQESPGNYDVALLEPIPLTEEWLLKFGFKKSPGIDGFYWDNGNIRIGDAGKFFILFGIDEYSSFEIKYVHQFQNIYFTLTGDELILAQ